MRAVRKIMTRHWSGAPPSGRRLRALAAQSGPAILVGHSYGAGVITEAGTDPRVKGLVCVAAFASDKGESVSSLIANPLPGAVARLIAKAATADAVR